MVEKEIIVKNKTGIHARPASQLVKECTKFESDIYIKMGEKNINAKSIISVLAAGLSQGTKIILCTKGDDEVKALESIANFIDSLTE